MDLTPDLTGLIAIGSTFNGTAAFNVPVSNQDRLVLVTRLRFISGNEIAATVTGYLSAGLAIA